MVVACTSANFEAMAEVGLSEVVLDQQACGVLSSFERTAVFDAVFVFPVVVFDTHVQLFRAPVQGFAQVIFDLWVEVQVGVIRAARVLIVVDHPVHVAVDDQIRLTDRQGVRPHWRDLPNATARSIAFWVAFVEVQLEEVKAWNIQVEPWADQVSVGVTFAKLIRQGQQHVFDGAELKRLAEDFAE